MMAVIHADLTERTFTLDPFALDRSRSLSLSSGTLKVFGWEWFKQEGLAIVRQAMVDFYTAYRPGLSEFDKMSRNAKIEFLRHHISFNVSRRTEDLWWIDLMQPVGDGTISSPIGPPFRAEFRPSEGPEPFFAALLQLMPPAEKWHK